MRLLSTAQPADGAAPPPAGAINTAKVAAEPPATADTQAVLLGYGLVIVGAAVGIGLWSWRDPASFTPGTGVSVFAPLYILAQSIERFIEPFTSMIKAPAAGGGKSKTEAMAAVNKALADHDVHVAATWQSVVDRIRRNTAVISWGIASFLGIVLCGLFGLYMLRLVGFKGVPEQVDLVISGLAVGSGTKPLHDLIANVQQKKESAQDPPEKQAA
jgi:hypothetical protein